ncbi:MAG TPA: thioredoxin domain-containing protein [Vicinamibacterales bacterium]|nr:thioredoxin domain-containing protein [Vicinamibacterales bacterium]
MNRLARERSPYLLQHAGNPVEWFPWGEEAFATARAQDRPIFLSIGYSTCHWCHVMEHESFENDAVAAVLNEHFVSIKVDREERPDVDRVYMAFVQATTGSGGWPMSVWLMPDLKPFYGGTYFPPTSRWGRPGFVDILQQIARVWKSDRAKVTESAESLTAQLRGQDRTPAATDAAPGPGALARTLQQFRAAFDGRYGSFNDAPKFPRPSELLFLLREHARTGDEAALAMTLQTLRAMALGGLRDHVGGGFHRYTVDAGWRVPHFEKMLYDQAQLVLAYVEASQAAADPFFMEVAEDTLLYVLREMTDAEGGFYCAEDADSIPPEQMDQRDAHKAEGSFYLWRADEVDALPGEDAPIVRRRFGIETGGNAPSDPQGEFAGKNILYVARSVEDLAVEFQRPADEIVTALNRSRIAMFQHRLGRPRPDRDDKILTAWNGLMIAAFARTARILASSSDDGPGVSAPYLQAASKAAGFIRERMWDAGMGRLRRRYRQGDADIDAYAEDYACLIFGLLELFQADPDPSWLEWAVALQRRQNELFWDENAGGWFSTTGHDPNVLLRLKEDYDGAEPSASSISAMNLMVLSHLLDDPDWAEQVERTLRGFGSRLEQLGRAVPMMAAVLSTHVAGPQQIVVIEGTNDNRALEQGLGRRYLPFSVLLKLTPEQHQRLRSALPFVAAMTAIHGQTSVYICRDRSCRAPVTDVVELAKALAPG